MQWQHTCCTGSTSASHEATSESLSASHASASTAASVLMRCAATATSAELKSAQAQVDGAEATREALELQVRADVQAAVLRYDAARARLALFDDAVQADGDRLLAMARTSYTEGRAQLFELLSAQRSWSDLQLAAEAARAESARATITLEAAAGSLSPQ